MKKNLNLFFLLMIVFSIFFYTQYSNTITRYGYYGESEEWRACVMYEIKDDYDYNNYTNRGNSVQLLEFTGDIEKYIGQEIKWSLLIDRYGYEKSGSGLFEEVVLENYNSESEKPLVEYSTFVFREKNSGGQLSYKGPKKIAVTIEINGEVTEELLLDQELIPEVTIKDYYTDRYKKNY